MNRLLTLAAAALATVAFSASARADSDSLFTLGVGAGVGVHKTEFEGQTSETALMNSASVRLKALYFLGADFTYDLTRDDALVDVDPSELRTRAKMRLTGLLYPFQGEYFSLYLGAGLGGSNLDELAAIDRPGNSYHAGGGLEFRLNDHITIDTSFFVLVPGVSSVVSSSVAQIDAALNAGNDSAAADFVSNASVGQFVSAKNHELMVRLFLYL